MVGDSPAEGSDAKNPQTSSTSDQADDGDDYGERDPNEVSSNCSSASIDSFYELEGNDESLVVQEPIVASKNYPLQRPLSFSPPRSGTPYSPTDLWVNVVAALNFFQFVDFLLSCLGGQKSSKAAKTIFNRCAWFTSWIFDKTSSPRDESSAEVIKRLRGVLTTERNYLLEWIQHLEKLVAPGTVANYIDCIANLVTWLAGLPLGEGEISFDGLSIREMLNNARRCERKGQLHRSLEINSYEALLMDGRFPRGGIAELESYVNQRMSWLYELKKEMETRGGAHLTARIYRQFLELLFAAMYVFSPQGRPLAIGQLTCEQARELITTGCTLSREFKTRDSALVYQPVLLPEEAKEIMRYYAEHIRPILERKGAKEEEGRVCASDHDRRFFLTFEGKEGERKITQLLRRFNQVSMCASYLQG